MSAFVVSEDTINRVVWFLANHDITTENGGRVMPAHPSYEDKCDLAQRMMDLNVAAVNVRYRESSTTTHIAHRAIVSTAVQAYKSLQCWLYQCTEGDIPEKSAFYHQMESVGKRLADHIVTNLPEYESAKWDH